MSKTSEMRLEKMIRDLLSEVDFGNVARPKPVKDSASSNVTQKTWGGKENARPSAATQGSWDVTNTPGGISCHAKDKWTKDQLVAYVTDAVLNNVQFGNKPFVVSDKTSASSQPSFKKAGDYKYGKTSASTQASFKKPEEFKYGKVSASTQSAWRKGVDGADYTMCYHNGSVKTSII